MRSLTPGPLQIDPAWMTAALRRAGVVSAAEVVDLTCKPVGAGSLQIAFEQLKARLQAEGLFAPERKKPLPAFPHCVGIVTSPSGAVIRDFLNVGSRRHEALNVLLYPAVVQGASAAIEVAAGIEYFNRTRLVDVIVIARGGGSLEDLAPFNSELLARAIAANAPLTVRACKAAIVEAQRAPDQRATARVDALVEACFQSADYVEGQRAFLEKRPPRFEGR